MYVNSELGTMWKEVILICIYKFCASIYLEGMKKTVKVLSV